MLILPSMQAGYLLISFLRSNGKAKHITMPLGMNGQT